jgi:hypothetical protein
MRYIKRRRRFHHDNAQAINILPPAHIVDDLESASKRAAKISDPLLLIALCSQQ